jgi:hypothetical protein
VGRCRNPEEELLPEPPSVSAEDTIRALLAASKRHGNAVPIRTIFVQQGARGRRVQGPLAHLVRARDELAFDLMMLVLLVASAPPHDITRPAAMWLRALYRDPRSKSAASVLSRAWGRLADRRLIDRSRAGRQARIELLREDGSGAPYSYPDGSDGDYYLKLPFVYWEEGLHRKLKLAAKAMLLVALAEQDGFSLPFERVADWYGMSADTAQRGFDQLVELGVLNVKVGYKRAPLTAQGWTEDRRYTVVPKYRVGAVAPRPQPAKKADTAEKASGTRKATPRRAVGVKRTARSKEST